MGRLRVLIAEDDPIDAELLVRELTKAGYDPDWQRVDSRPAFMNQLAHDAPDLIISDHAMPQFSSAEALRCVQESGLTIPFVVVSHAIGEEEAVGLMRQGAADFLMKDRLGRLGEAVRQALDKRRLLEAHAASQRAILALNEDLERRIDERTAELRAANRSLEYELQSRRQAEDALHRLNAELEQRVEKRTVEVVASRHRLRALASELTLAEQRERKRLAGELHDCLAQMLALGRMKIAQLRPPLAATAPNLTEPVREIDELFKNALTYTRSLMAKLSPPVLDELGLPSALKWLAGQMSMHGLTVDVRLEQDKVPLPDEQGVLLFQSVRELLLNVVKHAGTDQATVTLRMKGTTELQIEVHDAGLGFDATAFEGKSSDKHFGLFSVRERMEAMGGALTIHSVPHEGSTMTLILPLTLEIAAPDGTRYPLHGEEESTFRGASRPALDGASRLVRQGSSSLIRVLLVDDHVVVRQGLKALLDGFPNISVVGEAGDGEEGLTMAAQCEPDMVLMDVNMPWMDGIEATKRIKQEWPETRVVGLSVNNSPQIMEAMRSAGAVAFVAKDAAAEELYDTIVATMATDDPPSPPPRLF